MELLHTLFLPVAVLVMAIMAYRDRVESDRRHMATITLLTAHNEVLLHLSEGKAPGQRTTKT